jgi:adenine-specific DNA methylase
MDYMALKPIDAPITPMKQAAKRYYGSHPYFTKRAWNVVREYIKAYTDKGDVVLDPYGGSGITAIEALILGRKSIHIDIAPLANFITEQVAISPVKLSKLVKSFQEISQQCEKRINDLYSLEAEKIGCLRMLT